MSTHENKCSPLKQVKRLLKHLKMYFKVKLTKVHSIKVQLSVLKKSWKCTVFKNTLLRFKVFYKCSKLGQVVPFYCQAEV